MTIKRTVIIIKIDLFSVLPAQVDLFTRLSQQKRLPLAYLRYGRYAVMIAFRQV
jgi:hypothetical protein